MMNRREMLAGLAACAAAAGVNAEVAAIDAEPRPLLLVLKVESRLTCEAQAAIRRHFDSLRILNPELPQVIVLEGGATLEAVLDPRGK